MNVRPYTGPKSEHAPPVERAPWKQRRPHQERTIEDIIGLEVVDGKENPLKEVEKERE